MYKLAILSYRKNQTLVRMTINKAHASYYDGLRQGERPHMFLGPTLLKVMEHYLIDVEPEERWVRKSPL